MRPSLTPQSVEDTDRSDSSAGASAAYAGCETTNRRAAPRGTPKTGHTASMAASRVDVLGHGREVVVNPSRLQPSEVFDHANLERPARGQSPHRPGLRRTSL